MRNDYYSKEGMISCIENFILESYSIVIILIIIIIIILWKTTMCKNNCKNDTVDIIIIYDIIYDKYSKHIFKKKRIHITKKNLYIEK